MVLPLTFGPTLFGVSGATRSVARHGHSCTPYSVGDKIGFHREYPYIKCFLVDERFFGCLLSMDSGVLWS
jgi:hypothetical protein